MSIKKEFEKCLKKHSKTFIPKRGQVYGDENFIRGIKKEFNESDCQSLLCKWLKVHGWSHDAEVKCVSGGTLAFSKFEDQQLPSLDKVSNSIKYHKFTDASAGLKPYDYYCRKKDRAYVVIMFHKLKQQEWVYFIDINMAMLIKKLGYKSITEEMASCYGFKENLWEKN